MSATLNHPKFQVLLNGVQLAGVESVDVKLPKLFQVGTWGFTKAFVQNDKFPISFWAATDNKTLKIQILLSVDGVTYTPVITGMVDSHSWDVVENSLHVVGRDMAAQFLDARTTQAYRNLTSSEIAQKLAAGHGMQAAVTATKTLAGRYYTQDHDELAGGAFTKPTNEWDLLCRLGSKEGITPYTDPTGTMLHFELSPANPPVFSVQAQRDQYGNLEANVLGLKLSRFMVQAHDIIATVVSFHAKYKKTYSATVRTQTKSADSTADATPTRYYRTEPNLNQAQCLQAAQQWAKEISQHERPGSIDAASLVLLSPLHVVQVSTGTAYDQQYYVQSISYHIDFDGASTGIQVKNCSPLNLIDHDSGEFLGELA